MHNPIESNASNLVQVTIDPEVTGWAIPIVIHPVLVSEGGKLIWYIQKATTPKGSRIPTEWAQSVVPEYEVLAALNSQYAEAVEDALMERAILEYECSLT